MKGSSRRAAAEAELARLAGQSPEGGMEILDSHFVPGNGGSGADGGDGGVALEHDTAQRGAGGGWPRQCAGTGDLDAIPNLDWIYRLGSNLLRGSQ